MKSIAPVALLLILFACDYEPDGENLVVHPQPDASGMSIELTEATDTLFVFGNAVIQYNSITKNRPVKWFRAYLDGQLVGENYQSTSGTISLYTYGMATACHSLKIELVTGSGTGSLADQFGAEDFHLERTYVLCIDNSAPDPVAITSIRRVDGTLEVQWEKSKEPMFQNYKIFKMLYNQVGQFYEGHWSKEITDRNTTSLRDSTFIGGKVKYVIYLSASDQFSVGPEKEFEDPYDVNAQWQWGQKTSGKITWNKTKYYKNFTSYDVSFVNGIGDPIVYSVTNINDTTMTIDSKLVFSAVGRVTVKAYPVRIDNYHNDFAYGHVEGLRLGTPFPWYVYFDTDQTLYNQSLDRYFALQFSSQMDLVRIDPATNTIEQSLYIPISSNFLLSQNGQHLYVMQGDNFTKRDPLSFSIIQGYNVSTLCGPSGGINWTGSISGNNRLALSNASGSYVLDMNTFSLIQQWPFDPMPIQISPTGTFVLQGNNLLKWNSTQYVSVAALGDARTRIFVGNDSKLLLDKIDHVEVYNLATLSIEKNIILDGGLKLHYDPVSGMFGGYTDPSKDGKPLRYCLYKLDQSEKITEFPVAGAMMLMNNSMVASDGAIIPVSFYYP